MFDHLKSCLSKNNEYRSIHTQAKFSSANFFRRVRGIFGVVNLVYLRFQTET